MHELHLESSLTAVDVRLRDFNGRWIASADTPDGPTLGWGMSAIGALRMALEPFDEVMDELLDNLMDELTTPFWDPR